MTESVDIKDISGNIRFSTPINEGSKRKFLLMKEDYITLKFSLDIPIHFKLGDNVELLYDTTSLFEAVDLQKPVYNSSTGGYDYDLRLDAYYWKWKNKILKFTPETGGQEASWNLTASLDVQMGVFLRNLKALGYTYRGKDFEFSIDSSVENKSQLMSYDNTNMIDALTQMAKTWECEWWVTNSIIHFGRCEFGTPVDFELGVNVEEMTRSDSRTAYATRIYAFGSTRNIPTNYRPVDESVVVNGVVQRRLMLPIDTPYIDAFPGMSNEEAIEDVVIFDDVYPRRIGTVSNITTKEYTDKIENEDGTTTEKKWNAYRFKDAGITFSKEYVIAGEELKIKFESGLLNGMEFAVTFNPDNKPEKLEDGSWNPDAQVWEIVRNEDYGRPLPDDVLRPQTEHMEGSTSVPSDTYVMSGFDTSFVSDAMIPAAEKELKEKAEAYRDKVKIDPSTYANKMMSDCMVNEAGEPKFFEVGDRVNLINAAFFEAGSRQSRIIGFEYNLDIPYDSPVYTVGETASYSRIGEIEDKVDSLTYKGQTYTGGGGSGVYVIGTNDRTPASNRNVYSALRALTTFLRKDQADGTQFPLTFGHSARFGDYRPGISGGFIDKDGFLEMEEGIFRKRIFVPEIAYNRITYFKGRMVNSPGGGCTVKEFTDNGDGSYTITPDLTDADGLSQFVDDILTTYFTAKNAEGKLQGFEEMKFRVTAADFEAKTFVMVPRPGHDWKPAEAMVLAQTGNFTDPDRQTYILIDSVNGNNCITFFDNANTWDVEPVQEKSWLGKKKGRTVHGIPADNYSAVLQNIIMSGKIFQVDDITGEAFRVPLNKGAWKSGVKYVYYDEVTHSGSSWICVNENGTTSEPSDGNSNWLKYVSKGADGTDGISITSCGDWHTGLHVPYMGLVKMAGRVFLCKKGDGTDNPPMWTITDKDENRLLQTQDGGKTYGYIITGDLNTAEYELLVENGKDGRDGTNHEWIFYNTTTNAAPSTPATSQVDDYVPSGWHDDPIGVSESLPYEWACSRTKKDGVWSAFTPAALWAKFGFDGESVIIADIDNEMESIALTSEGNTTLPSVLNTTVSMFYGTEKLQLKAISCTTPSHVTESYNTNTGIIAFSIPAGVAMPARCQVKITVTASWQGVDYSRDLIFTIAGVRAGSPGTDAVLYRLVPSVSSVRKKKDGTYSVGSVSCTRTKTVGTTTSITTDGVLKYSRDGAAEVEIQNVTAISPNNFSTSLQFIYYVNGQVVDRETVPMVVDGVDGADGESIKGDPGTSVKAGGEWRTANTPIAALTICTMGGSSWLSKVATSNPPMWTVTDNDDNRLLQTQDGGRTYGYIITGEVNSAEWEQLTSDGVVVYLVSTVSNIRVSNAGSLVPSAFKIYAKRSLGSATLTYSDGYLAARGYSNGVWSSIAGPGRSSELTVNASAGYSTFSVRCYQTQADASAWNDSFIAEASVGVCYDGEKGGDGRTGSEPRPRGLFAKGSTYVWDEKYHDIVLATFNNRTVPFRVRAYGATVTAAPTSIDGDANWEPAQQFQFVATDLLLSRQIRADEILTNDLVVRNVLARDKSGNVTCEIDGETGDVYIKGTFEAISGIFKNIKSPNGSFKIDEVGNIEIIGKISTSLNGTRIEINPETNSIKMYNQNNDEVGSLSFFEEEWNGVINYIPRFRLRRYVDKVLYDEVSINSGVIDCYKKIGADNYDCLLNPSMGLIFSKNNVQTKAYSNK